MNPSDSSWRNASRIGVRLMPNLPARSGSATRVPAANCPFTIAFRTVSTIFSRRVRWLSIWILSFCMRVTLWQLTDNVCSIHQSVKGFHLNRISFELAERNRSGCGGSLKVRYLLPVPYVMRRGSETDGLDDSLHGPVPHAGAQGNGPPTFPVRGRAGDLLFRKHPRPAHAGSRRSGGRVAPVGGHRHHHVSRPLQRHLSGGARRGGPARYRSATAAGRLPRPPVPPPGGRDARRILGLALRLRRGSMAGGSEEDVFRSDGGGRKRGGRHLRRKRLRRGAGPSPPPPRGRRVEATGVLL